MKKLRSSLVILFCLWLGYSASAQESKFKALFIYKFAEYIEWPNGSGKIVVGVVGKTDVQKQLSTFAASKENIDVISIAGANDVSKCQIIFVPSSKNKMIPEFADKIGGNSVLLVSGDSEMVHTYADIGFYLESGKLRFLISPKSIEHKKMTPSSKLLSLGKNI
ncbi:MAG: YfiR family protein [Reichenbachiella sp.]